MRRAPVTLAVIASACLGGTACGPDLPERLWRSENVRYFSRADDDAVCPAILDELEQHGQAIADVLMLHFRTPVSYYKFNGLPDFNQHAECGPAAAACAPNATVRSPVDFDRHELIHAYLSPVGRPPWLLAEGTAVALSCQSYPRPTGSWRDAYALGHDDPALYAAGGWLVGYLLKMYPARYLPWLYSAAAINATADQFEQAFKDNYCVDPDPSHCTGLDTVWAAAIGGSTQPMLCPWECHRPQFAADGQPHALTPICSGGSLQLTVDVPNAGLSRWRIDGAGSFRLKSCDGSDAPQASVLGMPGPGELLAPLRGGTYFVDAAMDTGGTPALSGSVTMGEGLSWTDCGTTPALPDDLSGLASLTLFYPTSVTPQFTILPNGTGHDGQKQTLQVASFDASASTALCATCDELTCVPTLAGGSSSSIGTSLGQVVSVPGGAAVTATFSWQ
jgi:hypothetical protein